MGREEGAGQCGPPALMGRRGHGPAAFSEGSWKSLHPPQYPLGPCSLGRGAEGAEPPAPTASLLAPSRRQGLPAPVATAPARSWWAHRGPNPSSAVQSNTNWDTAVLQLKPMLAAAPTPREDASTRFCIIP